MPTTASRPGAAATSALTRCPAAMKASSCRRPGRSARVQDGHRAPARSRGASSPAAASPTRTSHAPPRAVPPKARSRTVYASVGIGPAPGDRRAGQEGRRARRRPPTPRTGRCGGDRRRAPVSRPAAGAEQAPEAQPAVRAQVRPVGAEPGQRPHGARPGRSRTRWNEATLVPAIAGHRRRGPVIDSTGVAVVLTAVAGYLLGLRAGGRAGRPGPGRGPPGGRRPQPRLLERQGAAGPPGRRPGLRRRRRQGRARRGRRPAARAVRGGSATSAAAAAMVGHAWPVFAGFRGGRSVLTFVGGMLVLAPVPALIAAGGLRRRHARDPSLRHRRPSRGLRLPADPGPVRAAGARRRHRRADVHHRPALRDGGRRRAPRRRRRHQRG